MTGSPKGELPVTFVGGAGGAGACAVSGPRVMPQGPLLDVGTGNSVTVPTGVILPISPVVKSVYQRLLSGPVVMNSGYLELSDRAIRSDSANLVSVTVVLSEPQIAIRP